MDRRDCLAGMHRSVVSDFIEAVVDEWAGDMREVERNIEGSLLRSELETKQLPGLTAVLALVMEADSETLGRDLPEWLALTSTVLPADAQFLTEMGRRVDPGRHSLLQENSGLSAGESMVMQEFRCLLWEMTPNIKKPR